MARPATWITILLLLFATTAAAAPLEFRLASDTREGEFQVEATNPSTGEPMFLSEHPALTSADLDSVRADDGVSGLPSLMLVFNAPGAEKFARVTAANIGSALAIVFDGEVITAPVIRAGIDGGRAQIETGGADLDRLLAALEDAGVTVGEPIRRPPPPTEEEIGGYLQRQAGELLAELDVRVAAGGYWVEADSVLLTTLVEMNHTLEMYDVDPSFRQEVWRRAESMWPEAAPRGWDDRVNVLIGLIDGAVAEGDLVIAAAHAEELLSLVETPPSAVSMKGDWGITALVDAYLAEGRTKEAEVLCRRALATPVRQMMMGTFMQLVDLLADTGRVDEARALCEAELAASDGERQSFLAFAAKQKLQALDGR